jgi:hypothetical protein
VSDVKSGEFEIRLQLNHDNLKSALAENGYGNLT